MIHYITKEETKTYNIMDYCECDICHTKYKYPDDSIEIDEFARFDFVGGYNSVFGDGNRVQVDICQHCFQRILLKEGVNLKDVVLDEKDSVLV